MQKTNTSSPGSTPNRRKRNMMPTKLHSANTSNTMEGMTENTAELQRLPLKKRHGHTTHQYQGAKEEELSSEETSTKTPVMSHQFGFATIRPVKVLPMIQTTSSFFGDKKTPSFTGFADLCKKPETEDVSCKEEKSSKLVQGRRSGRLRNSSGKSLVVNPRQESKKKSKSKLRKYHQTFLPNGL